MTIAIIDYNGGNTASMKNALIRLGFSAVVTNDQKVILSADKVIFPGQGRAGSAMRNLRPAGLNKTIRNITKPFLGVCLGMQLLFDFSEEDNTNCLGIIKGKVKRFQEPTMKIPQIGWNTVTETKYHSLFRNVPDIFYAYFVNSYYAETESRYVIGKSAYGDTTFPSVVRKDNFYGVQFHPEKSGTAGLELLKNFCELGILKQNETLVIPAIDLMNGKCVRLRQGDYDKKTIYSDNPLFVARSYVKDGATYLHIVDLDGAKVGEPLNGALIKQIAKEVTVPVQAGGGIRTFKKAKEYLDAGVERIILGTSALENPTLIQKVIAEYGPGRVVVSVDVKDKLLATEGWQKTSSKSLEAILSQLTELGITTIIYTDIQKDGTMAGPNYEGIREMLTKPFRVIVAGGIGNLADIQKLNEIGAYGVIVGKALYENAIDLKKANKSIPSPSVSRSTIRPARNVTKRIIACMDIAEGRVVKGTNFKNLRDAGNPVELGKYYSENGADELVFLDIAATIEGRKTLYGLVGRIAQTISVPFTVGGGGRTTEDIKKLLDAGADKVSIGSAAVTNPNLVTEAAREFGSQCIVMSVDPKKRSDGSWEIYIKGGREATGIDVIRFCREMEKRGAGELLVNSLDRDGTKKGYDLELLRNISESVSIPVIASSGAGLKEDFREALSTGKADAALAASLFHTGALRVQELKAYLQDNGIAIRL